MDEKPKDLWKEYSPAYQFHVTISTIDSTINSENIDERVVYIEDLEKRKQAYGICGECKEPDFLNEIKSHLQINLHDIVQCFGITQDPNNKEYMMFSSDATQSTSANPISECLDVQLSELELNEICQDSENNIE
ncbi:unnamed protein product [Rhizophagus irregularis]|uniref:Uncharacterized protein n=1 Tax=Rhizophagus irregularis TaxID=588596 RepID=A0A916EJF8_9GLOM|nr:unnamed protein product [Rhizophagus irregularis]